MCGKNFKKFNVLVILLMITYMLLTCNAFGKTTTLKLVESNEPIGLPLVFNNALAEEIKSRTNGQVEVEIYWSGTLLSAAETINGIKNGIVEMGKINSGYSPEELFCNDIFTIFPQGPVEFENINELIKEIYETIPNFTEELTALNQKFMGFRLLTPTSFFCTEPLTRFEDLKGKKIRASNRWWLGYLEGAGAVPVNIEFSECYMAMATSNIHGVYTDIATMVDNKFYEVAHNVFLTKDLWTPMPMIYTINMDVWNQFSDDIKAQIGDSFNAAAATLAEAYKTEWDKVVSILREQENMVITEASPEDIQKWASMPIVKKQQDRWISEAKDRGITNAEEIVKTINDLIKNAIEKEKSEN